MRSPRSRRRKPVSHASIAAPIATAVVPSVAPAEIPGDRVTAELRALVGEGAKLKPAGTARRDPDRLLRGRHVPRHFLELFGVRFYLTDYFQTPALRFFVAYVVLPAAATARATIHPRIFYKDGSLIWRAASHMVANDEEFWIGKGDVRDVVTDGEEMVESVESTTDLPFEMQTALEAICRRTPKARRDGESLELVLRSAPSSRIVAYPDFTEPRRRAATNPKNRVNGGRSVARFRRRRDPSSLEIAPGFEPDFRRGVIETAASTSVLYGGKLERYRIVSVNRRIQYLFFAGPRQVWIIPPQATTTELSSFGVRTVDVVVDDDMCVPGYEYHYMDEGEDGPYLYSQIPAGFAGPAAPTDPDRADASPWLDRMPVVRDFRRIVLGK